MEKNTTSSSNQNWDQNSIRSYLQGEFKDSSQDLVSTVTDAVWNEGKNNLDSIIRSYETNKNFDRYNKLKSIPQSEHRTVFSMLESIHRRFVAHS